MPNTIPVPLILHNTAPYASDAYYSVLHDTTLSGQVYGYDPDGDAITAQLVSDPSNGSLTFNSDGTFTYIPNSHYVGSDSFTYTWSDSISAGNTATVTIEVYNTAPYADDGYYYVLHDTTLSGQVYGYDPDGDAITAQLVNDPSNGMLTFNADGTFTYTPNSHYVGSDSFTYTWSDGIANANMARIYIYVYNADPQGMDDYYILDLQEQEQLVGSLLANDYDPDGDQLVVTSVNGQEFTSSITLYTESGALLTVNSDGSFVYQAGEQVGNQDVITYIITDGVVRAIVTAVFQVLPKEKINFESMRFFGNVGRFEATVKETGQPASNNDNSRGKVNFATVEIEILRLDQNGQAVVDARFDVNNTLGITEFWFEFYITNSTPRSWQWMQVELGFFTDQQFVRSQNGDHLDFDFPDRDLADWPFDGHQRLVKYATQNNMIDRQRTVEGSVTIEEDRIKWDGQLVRKFPTGVEGQGPFFFNVDVPDFIANKMPMGARTNKGYTFTIRVTIQAAPELIA